MPGTIFFQDTRHPQGIDHVSSRCLLFKNDDPFLAIPLPDGERFFLPDGDTLTNANTPPGVNDPKRPFTIPSDVNAPIKAVVDVESHANIRDCPFHMVPDGGTLSYDGTTFTVIPPTTPPTITPKPGCATMAIATIASALGLLAIVAIFASHF